MELNYRTLPAISTYPSENNPEDVEFEGNRLLEAKVNIPVILKERLKVITQLKYKNEVLNLGENEYYERYIKLRNTGISVAYQWYYKENNFIAGHISSSLKSDDYDFNNFSSMLDYNSSILIGKSKDDMTMAFGFLAGNRLGRFNIYPLFIYENQLSPNLQISMKLPKEITLSRALLHDNFYLTGSVKGHGAAYFLNSNSLEGFDAIEYRRRAIDLQFGLEKEIRDWMWFGVYTGVTTPLNSILVNPGDASRHKVHDFNQKFTPFVNFSLFVVPPRSLYMKLKN